MRTQNKRLIVEDFACISCMPSSNTFKAMPSVSNGASFTLQFNPPSNPVMQWPYASLLSSHIFSVIQSPLSHVLKETFNSNQNISKLVRWWSSVINLRWLSDPAEILLPWHHSALFLPTLNATNSPNLTDISECVRIQIGKRWCWGDVRLIWFSLDHRLRLGASCAALLWEDGVRSDKSDSLSCLRYGSHSVLAGREQGLDCSVSVRLQA